MCLAVADLLWTLSPGLWGQAGDSGVPAGRPGEPRLLNCLVQRSVKELRFGGGAGSAVQGWGEPWSGCSLRGTGAGV